jgi:hypothetical protein
MALNENERALLEAVSTLLKQDAKLGLPISGETSHTSQFRWEGIDDAFALKVANSPFSDAIRSAFFAVHTHKYIDNPTFKLSFEKELTGRAVPTPERTQALKYLEEMVGELSSNKLSERDAGWNPNMADLVDLTSNADNRTPKSEKPFTGGGPSPEGERGGKGGIYMESMYEDTVDHYDWTIAYGISPGEESPRVVLKEAKNIETGEIIKSQKQILKRLKLTPDEFYSLII